jgi:GxxExxY protein
MLHEQTTGTIINAFYQVYNTLGFGFLEQVYENALYLELRSRGQFVEKQRPINVHYEGTKVGDYFADLIVDRTVIIEPQAADGIAPEHTAQLLNYLKATEIEVGLLLNFGPKQFERKVFSNENKKATLADLIENP